MAINTIGVIKNGNKIKIPTVFIQTNPDAQNISYDNTQSGLVATNVQDAIDEVASGTFFQVVNGELCQVYDDGQ